MMSAAEAEVTGNMFEADSTYPFFLREEAGYHFTTEDSPKAAFLHCGRIVYDGSFEA